MSEALSHVLRAREVGFRLKDLGWQVSHVASDAAASRLTGAGISFHSRGIPWRWGHNRYGVVDQTDFYTETCRHLESALKELRPDVVIGIPGIASFQVCRKLGIPHHSILHGPWLSPLIPTRGADSLPGEVGALTAMNATLAGPVSEQLRLQSRSLGITETDYKDFLQFENILVSHTGLEFTPSANLIPLESITADYGPTELPAAIGAPESLACITFGSAVRFDAQSLVEQLEAVCDRVLVVGRGATVAKPGPKVVQVDKFNTISLARQSSIVVCHGGIGTVASVMSCGTPVVCIPNDVDQAVNSIVADRMGQGQTVGLSAWRTRNPAGREFPAVDSAEIGSAVRRALDAGEYAPVRSEGALQVARYLHTQR
ncbi:glycosyltransferase [Streptomyces sp. NPDC048357]|uniref:glycosyltransferase n=1 Tax=Streptomyces sp. NPDC048357 TaxID=3154719 RepID=UPI003445362C